MTATMDNDASVVGQPNHPSQNLPCFNSHTPPAQPSHSITIPRDTVKSNQTNDAQSGVKHGHEAGTNHNSQTDDEQSDFRNGNEAVENKNGQTDDEQCGITHGQETGANKPVSHFTVIGQQGELLDFAHSIAHCISADFKLGLVSQNKSKKSIRVISRRKRNTSNKYYTPSNWVMINLFFT